MARKDIINELSYNQGFYNANDNFIELYNLFESGFKYRGNLTSLYPGGKSINTLLPGIYNVNSWSNITDYPPDAYPYGLLVVFTPSVTTFAKAQMYFPDNRDYYYFRNGYGTTYNQWLTIPSTKQPSWITATLQNGWTGTLRYRINQTGQLEIRGDLVPGDLYPAATICFLPEGYRPAVRASISCTASQPKIGELYISTNGSVTVAENSNIVAGDVINFAVVVPLG